MPKKGSPKSGAKKKLTKAEKEKLKKEEDDRRKEEEEEARKKAEQEEQERINKEKAELEETRRLENEERKRRKGQLLELESIWEGILEKLRNEAAHRRVKAKWDRYMKCDGSPDPTILGEINTYMNLWREDSTNDIQFIMQKGKQTLDLVNELAFLLVDTPSDELPETTAAIYRNTMSELQALLQSKLDLGSHGVLLKATELADPETMNLEQVIGNEDITLCTWGNLSKNPRVKSFEFETKGFQFELPKLLTLTDCAFRVLFTKYDHYSPKCVTYMPRLKKKEEAVAEEKVEEAEKEQKEGEGEEGEKEKEETGEEQAQDTAEKEANEDVMKELEDVKEDEPQEEAEPTKEEAKGEDGEPMEEEYEITTPEPVEWEDFDGADDVIDLRASHILGGIFHFNLLALPPQPKNYKNWVIRQVSHPEGLQNLDYKAEAPSAAPPSASSKDADEETKPKKEEKPPITVNLKLPKDIYFCEEPQIVRWDSSDQLWHLDGFSDQSFDEDLKILSFKVFHFGVMALVQESHINMPFQSWEVRPRGQNHVIITIIAAIIEIEIEIKDDKCCVNVPDDKPELKHFKGQMYSPKDLIKKLRNCGVNIFPAEDSHKYVSIQNKHPATEERLYQQMALTASSMAYSWSKWNKEGDDRIVVQGCEHLVDEPLLEEDWSLFMISKLRTTKLKMVEFDENFSEEHAEGTEFHADLYHMVTEISSEKGKKRITSSHHHFVDAVYQILRGTRVITFS